MTDPADISNRQQAQTKPARVTERRDYLRIAATGRRWITKALLVQYMPAQTETDTPARFGITVSKKVGNAVTRSKMKRRLREIVRSEGVRGEAGASYVLVARAGSDTVLFQQLQRDFVWALRKLREGADLRSNRRDSAASRAKGDT